MNNLRIVEIELFSYCNRTCPWCPNSFIDRISDNHYLEQEILEKLIKELYENKFHGVFSFSRYNEPFSDLATLNSSIDFIKSYFPNNKMVTNTNSDFVTKESIVKMKIDELTIMDYDCRGKDFVYEKMKSFDLNEIIEYNNYFIGYYKNKTILYYYSWPKTGTISDRGGSLSQYSKNVRETPCYEPFYFIGINYDGTVSPCCNIRNDIQKEFVLGDLHDSSLKEILNSDKFINFKNRVAKGEYTEDMPCYYCNNGGGRYTRKKGGILYE